MSSISRPSSGNSASGGGGGIRGFFSKLRKPSDQLMATQQVQVGSRTFEAHELQKLIPQLEEAIARKDAQLRQQQVVVEGHIKRISELEQEVTSLQRECDKLRSVLEQKAQSAASPGQPSSPSPRAELNNDLQHDSGQQRSKKIAVSAEPTNFDNKQASLQHYPKTIGAKQLIRDAVQKNDFLKQLAKEQIIELVNCMYEMRARAGQWVIQEGEPGDRLFVVAEGELQVSREGQMLGKMRAGTVMGELAILYNCTRYAAAASASSAAAAAAAITGAIYPLGVDLYIVIFFFVAKIPKGPATMRMFLKNVDIVNLFQFVYYYYYRRWEFDVKTALLVMLQVVK
ncbi:unnamed protein product [Caenorhabditis bovis]|uniref:Cyclic nucleotide-binding domain-containing protein n=1 Tax=Caenorhabditis bovis TaxID=2654633 RepID=A0A8S1F5W3_9PELO|nr:unnamed protein product [Caenorhabditis bovis]